MSHYLIPDWPAPSHIRAYTTLRADGHSAAPFNKFNLAKDIGDTPDAVTANREQLKEELGITQEPAWLKQVHGTTVIPAENVNDLTFEADASYTHTPQVVCAVTTADCLPLLLCDERGTEVAAIHAGWRGLAAGVIEATIEKLTQPYEFWLAWLGPAIGPTAFEVGDEVREHFINADPNAVVAFQSIGPNAWYADLYLLAKQRLAKFGIKRVYGGDCCTFKDATRFYSYRRDKGKTGRMASLIWIEKI